MRTGSAVLANKTCKFSIHKITHKRGQVPPCINSSYKARYDSTARVKKVRAKNMSQTVGLNGAKYTRYEDSMSTTPSTVLDNPRETYQLRVSLSRLLIGENVHVYSFY